MGLVLFKGRNVLQPSFLPDTWLQALIEVSPGKSPSSFIHSPHEPMMSQRLLNQNPIVLSLRKLHKESYIPVKWGKPDIGWTKLNFDGSSKGKTGMASIGGVFRNHKAEFMLGYAESIGKTTSMAAELQALRRGLELVLENGWYDVWLEGDAKALIDIITKKKSFRSEEVQKNVRHINLMIPELNNCIVTHIYREGNRAADKLAQMGHQLNKPHVWRYNPPEEVLRIMHEDAQGKSILRRRK